MKDSDAFNVNCSRIYYSPTTLIYAALSGIESHLLLPMDTSDDELFGLDETCVHTATYNNQCDVEKEMIINTTTSEHPDDILYKKLKKSLTGVPPGPKLTHPQMTIDEILNLLNREDWTSYKCNASGVSANKFNCDESKGKSCTWPEIKQCVFYDISYNLNEKTEQISRLCDDYRERFVGCETASFVTSNSPSKYAGKKKECRKVRSPKKCTYLSRHKQIFSQVSLQEAIKTNKFGIPKKAIFVPKSITKRVMVNDGNRGGLSRSPSKLKALEIRRSLWLQRKIPNRGTPVKNTTPLKSIPKKQTQKYIFPPRKSTPKKKKGTPKKCTPSKSTASARRNRTPLKQTPRKHNMSKKALECNTLNQNEKIGFLELNDEKDNNCINGQAQTSFDSDNSLLKTNPLDLSDSQRRKLLWAVSQALKTAGINDSHKNFKYYGRRVFKICKLEWIHSSIGSLKWGISEHMLSLATKHVGSVINENHSKTDIPNGLYLD